MRLSRLIQASPLLLFPLLGITAELKVIPGMWETTMTRTNPMNGEAVTETKKNCVTQTSFDPATMMQDTQGCKVVQDELDGDTLSFKMQCSMSGAESTVTGKYQSDGDTGSGDMNIQMSMAGMNMNMSMNWTAKRVGDC